MKTCQYFEVKHYEWRSVAQTRGLKAKTKRVLGQFTPYNFTTFHWGGTNNFKSYFIVVWLLSVCLVAELNSFYLKYLLWIDVAHPWVTIRVVSIFIYSVPAIRELYDYMNDPRYALARSLLRFVCGLTPVSPQPLCPNGPARVARARDDRDRGARHRQMGRLPPAVPDQRPALPRHGRRVPCCVPDGQVWGPGVARVPARAAPEKGRGARRIMQKIDCCPVLAHALVVVVVLATVPHLVNSCSCGLL